MLQDTGVSVRKRVIKIMKDICVECPDFPKIPEICVKMIRRVNDEEGIRKLVMEVFQVSGGGAKGSVGTGRFRSCFINMVAVLIPAGCCQRPCG